MSIETAIGFKVEQAEKLLSRQGFDLIFLKQNGKIDKKNLIKGESYLVLTQNRRGIVIKQEELHY